MELIIEFHRTFPTMYSFIACVPGIISHLNLCVPLLNTHARSLFCFIFMGCEEKTTARGSQCSCS